MNIVEVEQFEKLAAQLDGLHQEISTLTKKTPNDAVNAFKLGLINAVLSSCNQMFGEGQRPFPEFTTFQTDSIPSNSDVTFILSQYIECAEQFRSENIFQKNGSWLWRLEDGGDEIRRTSIPKKLIRK